MKGGPPDRLPPEYRTYQLIHLGVPLATQGYDVVGPGLCDWFIQFANIENEKQD